MASDPQITTNGSNFFSSGLRQKVDQLMNILYAGGVNNPMDSIEQISYLLFLRLLTEKDETLATLDKKYKRIFSGKWSRFAWGNFVTLAGDELFDAVRNAIESLHELPGLTDTGKLLFSRATLKIYDRPTLRAIIQGIQEFDLAAHEGHDFKGDMYEYLLSKLAASGTNGQFRSPRHIIAMIVAMVNPLAGFPERERDATLSLLYEEVTESVFHFHLCLESAATRQKAASTSTRAEKLELLNEYRAKLNELARLYENA